MANLFDGIPQGTEVRGTIGKTTTFRVHRGRQISYSYVVSSNPRTTLQQHWRGVFRCAMYAWSAFTEEEKKLLEQQARQDHFYSGFLTHMSAYLRGYKAWLEEQ